MKVEETVLEGATTRLEPLSLSHHLALSEVGLDPTLWEWVPYRVRTREEMRKYIEDALALKAKGTALPFATVDRTTGQVVGSTRFLNIDTHHRHVEIGSTWVAPAWQRTSINTEA